MSGRPADGRSPAPGGTPLPADGAPVVRAERLCASYGEGRLRQPVLTGLDLRIEAGTVTAIMGPSGSGKSTLLALLGGLERAESGRLTVAGQELTGLTRRALARFRRSHVGFVFQSFHLLGGLTALENVVAALEPLRPSRSEARRRSEEALDAVGLGPLRHRFPSELSGGEQQRVAVARAAVKRPTLLLADEPTGSLDAESGRVVLDLLAGGAREGVGARTVVLVTHDAAVAARAARVLRLEGGVAREAAPEGADPTGGA